METNLKYALAGLGIIIVILGIYLVMSPGQRPATACPTNYAPVCGSNGQTYSNGCLAAMANISVVTNGACPNPTPTPTPTPTNTTPQPTPTPTPTPGVNNTNSTPSPTPTTAACVDSDPANSPTVAGRVTLSDGSSGTDTCTSLSGGIEYYCSNENMLNREFTCSSGMTCNNGRCVESSSPSPTPTVTCTDADNGENLFVRANTTNSAGLREQDQCAGLQIKEFSCAVNGSIVSRNLDCPAGYRCSDGICASTSPTCNDPDGGRNIYNSSTVTRGDASEPDSCRNEATVKEFYCDSSGRIVSEDIPCGSSFTCSMGQCVNIRYAASCVDSDLSSPEPSAVAGNVSGYTTFAPYTHIDSCTGRDVKEQVCSGDAAAQTTITCPLGSPCSGGACTLSCERPSPDANATDPYVHGTTYDGARALPDTCLDSENLRKFTCDGSRAVLSDIWCGNGAYCDASSGKCIARCRDGDGYDPMATSGAVFYGSEVHVDTCEGTNLIREQICDGSGSPAQTTVDCRTIDPSYRCIPSTTVWGSTISAHCGS